MEFCCLCKYSALDEKDFPCNECQIIGNGEKKHFVKDYIAPEQPTKPPMPPVNPPKDEEQINHPDRYAGGKFECIDVMIDVFGEEAVKHFCLLNAFKYIWRQEKKGGVEDVKKAVWFLNKYIELSDSHENV